MGRGGEQRRRRSRQRSTLARGATGDRCGAPEAAAARSRLPPGPAGEPGSRGPARRAGLKNIFKLLVDDQRVAGLEPRGSPAQSRMLKRGQQAGSACDSAAYSRAVTAARAASASSLPSRRRSRTAAARPAVPRPPAANVAARVTRHGCQSRVILPAPGLERPVPGHLHPAACVPPPDRTPRAAEARPGQTSHPSAAEMQLGALHERSGRG
jgi:hypothetical protein